MLHRITSRTLRRKKQNGEKIVCLTAYDASFARLAENAGVDVLLVGDSLGNVIQGHATTLPVTMGQMLYHTVAVSRVCQNALVLADMPFLAYATVDLALVNAGRFLQKGGAHMVKLEGGTPQLEKVRRLTEEGIPVCGHLGLQPQSVHRTGYRTQGQDEDSARRIATEAQQLQEAGAVLLVLECVPFDLAQRISVSLAIPTIGIGAGPACDGQVLVLYDLLGITPPPRFAKDFLSGRGSIAEAITAYVVAVRAGTFPESDGR